jgi:hypothetical protein
MVKASLKGENLAVGAVGAECRQVCVVVMQGSNEDAGGEGFFGKGGDKSTAGGITGCSFWPEETRKVNLRWRA